MNSFWDGTGQKRLSFWFLCSDCFACLHDFFSPHCLLMLWRFVFACMLEICIRLFIPPMQSLPRILGFLVFRRCPSMTPSVCWRRTCQSLSIKWGKLLRRDAPVMCGFHRLGHQKKFQRITMHHVRWLGFKKREEWWLERLLSSRKNDLSIERNKLAKV